MTLPDSVQGPLSVIYGRLLVNLPKPTTKEDLSQQIIVVTGANRGLGFEAARHLSRLGVGKLILAVRDVAKGEEAKKVLLKSTGRLEDSIEVWPLDMDSYDSIKACAVRATDLPRLDGVLANAGIMTSKFGLSEGIEKTLNVNVVSTFLLYLLVLPKLRETAIQHSTVNHFSIPNSALHYLSPLNDLKSTEPGLWSRLSDPSTADMTGTNRYNLSKLLVIYLIREFNARAVQGEQQGSVVLNTPNPSFCKSDLAHESQSSAAFRFGEKIMARSTEEGSRTLVHGMLAGPESNGQYLNNCRIQSPAQAVTGAWGQNVQKYVFKELMDKLEQIQPGISATL